VDILDHDAPREGGRPSCVRPCGPIEGLDVGKLGLDPFEAGPSLLDLYPGARRG
jgi:hypothetical protein